MLLPPKTLEHVITALGATPAVLARLVTLRPESDPGWDLQLPNRFTPREHVAHMADWEDVFYARVQQTMEQSGTVLPNPDETQLSVDHNYAISSPLQQAQVFAEKRERLRALLKGLSEEEWARKGTHPAHGPVSVEAQAVHALGHDGYHLDFLARHL